jgi:riboflavin biosynthesis pyrimidine reductase
MSELPPLEALYDARQGIDLPLPAELASLYGPLWLPPHPGRPLVVGNFVTTLDGVVSLQAPGHEGGDPISGSDPRDRMVMGLLRALADVVIVGAGTVRAADRRHLWTAGYICPSLAGIYGRLRAALGKTQPPLNVIVTARGDLDPDRRVFQSGEVPALIVTTATGAQRVRERGLLPPVQVIVVEGGDRLRARSVLDAVGRARPAEIILVEGGPHLIGDFFAERCLDELFLTLAPQIAGRGDSGAERPGLVEGRRFAPEHPLWGTLAGVKRGGSHLFLRYSFGSARPSSPVDQTPGLQTKNSTGR